MDTLGKVENDTSSLVTQSARGAAHCAYPTGKKTPPQTHQFFNYDVHACFQKHRKVHVSALVAQLSQTCTPLNLGLHRGPPSLLIPNHS